MTRTTNMDIHNIGVRECSNVLLHIVWGKAELAIRPSRTILHDALNGQNCSSVSGFRLSCTVRIMTAGGGRGLGHETIRMRTIYN